MLISPMRLLFFSAVLLVSALTAVASCLASCGGEQAHAVPMSAAPPAASPAPTTPTPRPPPTSTAAAQAPVDAAPPPALEGQPCETAQDPTLACAEGLVCRTTLSIVPDASDAAGVCVKKDAR
jgi:hypothetical protein